jgi:glutamate/tyrosine decarboxylase-like PLP-dependent enzyme
MKELATDFRNALHTAFDRAISHLEHLDESPVAATAGPATLRARLNKPLSHDGVPAQQVIEDLVRDVEGGLLGSAGSRFFGWVIGGALPAAVAADWLTSAWQQNAALYACSPAAAVVEETVGVWLKDILGLPPTASFALVTGCQMAHVTCLAAARHALLDKHGWDVESEGLYGAPPIRILSSSERHASFERAVRLLGFGT